MRDTRPVGKRTLRRMLNADYGAPLLAAMNVVGRKYPWKRLWTTETDDGGIELEFEISEEDTPVPVGMQDSSRVGRWRIEMSFPSATKMLMRIGPESLQ